MSAKPWTPLPPERSGPQNSLSWRKGAAWGLLCAPDTRNKHHNHDFLHEDNRTTEPEAASLGGLACSQCFVRVSDGLRQEKSLQVSRSLPLSLVV